MILTEMAETLEKALAKIKELELLVAVRVPRRDYDAIVKSMSMCQNQIETMALELTRLEPRNRVAQDAFVVLGLLESMITANPDMQTEDWKADQKAKQAKAEEAEEKRRSEAFAKKWEGTETADDKSEGGYVLGHELVDIVKKEHKP